jgi:hypothetical protein
VLAIAARSDCSQSEFPIGAMIQSLHVFSNNTLALALFGGVPYRLDEAGVVKRVFKAGCVVGARM